MIGLILMMIIAIPVTVLILAAILGKPWKPRVTLVFIGMVFTLAAVFIAFTWLFGTFLSIFIP